LSIDEAIEEMNSHFRIGYEGGIICSYPVHDIIVLRSHDKKIARKEEATSTNFNFTIDAWLSWYESEFVNGGRGGAGLSRRK
jgi:hypothetical protein